MDTLLHAAMRAKRGSLLFETWWEARALWDRCVKVPGLVTLTLMPDHIHAILKALGLADLYGAMRGYALWRNRRRGQKGAIWQHYDTPVELKNDDHARRTTRYALLNPCRAGLVNDPLAWAFSTHRDALGLAIPPARRRVPQPARFHAYVSGDPSVRPEGTPLPPPVLAGEPHPARFRDVVAAVSALTRTPVDKLSEDKDARDLVVNAARLLAGAKLDDLVELTGAPRRSLQRIPIVRSEQVKIVEQVIGDPRFAVLEAGDLRQLPNWERYRHRG